MMVHRRIVTCLVFAFSGLVSCNNAFANDYDVALAKALFNIRANVKVVPTGKNSVFNWGNSKFVISSTACQITINRVSPSGKDLYFRAFYLKNITSFPKTSGKRYVFKSSSKPVFCDYRQSANGSLKEENCKKVFDVSKEENDGDAEDVNDINEMESTMISAVEYCYNNEDDDE